MVGFDDAAKMGLGVINSGVQIAGQQYQKRQQKKLTKLSKADEARKRAFSEKQFRLENAEADRNLYNANQEVSNNRGDQQGYGGSQERHERRQNNEATSRRKQALLDEQNMLRADWMSEDRARSINKKIAKNAARMQMISSLLQQGASSFGGGMV